MWTKGNGLTLLVGMQIGAATVENSMEFPQKTKDGTAFWPSDPTSENISEGTQNTNLKEYKHSYVHSSIIYYLQDMEAAQASIYRWVYVLWYTYTMEYYSAIKRRKFYPLQQYGWTLRTLC